VARLEREVLSTNGYVTGHLEGEPDAPSCVPNIVGQQALRQLSNVRAVLENAQLVDQAGLAVIGREVTLRDAGWDTSRYLLVIPGEGNAAAGSVSVDSPVGMASAWPPCRGGPYDLGSWPLDGDDRRHRVGGMRAFVRASAGREDIALGDVASPASSWGTLAGDHPDPCRSCA